MKIERVTLRQIGMPLVHFFETSFSRTTERHMILVEAHGDGVSGWGEVTAGENPFYNEEWTASAWPILRDYAIPAFSGANWAAPRTSLRLRRTSAATRWRAEAWKPPSGTCRRASRAARCGRPSVAARAAKSLRSLHRHPGLGAAASRKN